MTTKYIAYDESTSVIYGIGDTEEDAIRDGGDWAADCGNLKTCPATLELTENVLAIGGDPIDTPWAKRGGIATAIHEEVAS